MDLSRATIEELKKELARREHCEKMPQKNIILLGAPGSGKGTQSTKIIDDYCYCQISIGDLLRDHIQRKTPQGLKAKPIMDRGELVPDDLVNSILVDAIKSPQCARGIIFDGYPRNSEQATNLEKLLSKEGKKIHNVIELKVDEDDLIERVEGRRIHPSSGRAYHIKFNPPKVEGKDDVTGEPLIQRDDDKAETLKKRLQVYREKTEPIKTFYAKKGILSVIPPAQIEKTYRDINSILL